MFKIALLSVCLCLLLSGSWAGESEELPETTTHIEDQVIETTTARKATNFLRAMSDSLRNVQSQMQKGFKDLSNNIRGRINPTTTTTESPTMEEEEEERPVWDVVEANAEIPTTTTAEELDNRFLIDAPDFCPKGMFKSAGGKCRKAA